MATSQSTLHLTGFGKQKLAAVSRRAKELGMTPQRYLRHLVEEDLEISEQAKTMTFEELLGSGQPSDEQEIDRLVERAKTRYYQRKSRKG